MPIYEFYCPDNHKIYSFLARTGGKSHVIPRCPENPKFRMQKAVSSFAFIGRAGEQPAGGPEDLDDPRMASMMAGMEKEMSGMDEENPDPRALARLMRKMGDLSGEPMPSAVEEMIARMEKGEDPEKLEEEYGDALENFDPMGGEEAGAEGDERRVGRRLRFGRPARDPALYELSDYVERKDKASKGR